MRKHVEELQQVKEQNYQRMDEEKGTVLHLSKVINKFFRDDIILNEDENKIEKLRIGKKGEHPSVRRLRGAYVKIYDC